MTKALVYLDTSIWNVLADQCLSGTAACESFSNHKMEVGIGLNAYYELLRSFYGKKPARGSVLFKFLGGCLDSRVRVLRTWEELLIEESKSLFGLPVANGLFCEPQFQAKLTSVALDAARGRLHPSTSMVIMKRASQSKVARDLASQSLQNQRELTSDLRRVDAAELPTFLDEQVHSAAGRQLLANSLSRLFLQFEQELPTTAENLAARLLESSSSAVAHAIVRSNIYQTWRIARRDSAAVPNCVPDDLYHVVNAAYCDFFITEDQDGQADAAFHALKNVRVLIYENRRIPFLEWPNEKSQVKAGLEFMESNRHTFQALAKST